MWRRALLLYLAFGSTAFPAEMPGRVLFLGGGESISACADCHGATGEGNTQSGFPALAGQPEAYLAKQLQDYRSGLRASSIMEPIARQITPSQAGSINAYIATLPAPASISAGASNLGRQLALVGKWEVGVPPCDKCHGTNGRAIAPHFPALAGQRSAYIIDSLEAFRSEARRNDPLGLMRKVAKELTREEVAAAAHYYQAQGRKP
ncbi:MAG: c-type cytochrome [Sterolibacterium sp.]